MTNILFTIKNLDSAGMKYVLADIVTHLDKSRFNPIVLVGKKTGSNLEKKIQTICEVHELSFKNPGVFRFFPMLLKSISRVKSSGDIGHSFDYSSDWFEALIFKLAGVPLISEKTNLSLSSKRWVLKLALSKHIICLSNAQKLLLKKYSNKLSLIPTGVDIESYDNSSVVDRKQVGLSDNDIVLICVAHLVKVKGYEELIKAMAAVKDTYPNLKILSVGTGDTNYSQKLKTLAADSGIGDRILFYGSSENVAGLYKMADGKILATRNTGRREAYGAVIIEAMACRLPVIATKSGGPEDLIINDVTGWLVEAEGFEPLVSGIHKFMKAKSNWNEMGRAALNRVKENYSLETMVTRYSEVYRSVAETKGQR